MRVRMRTLMAGPFGTVRPGDELDLPNDEAQALLVRRFADLVHEQAVEGAVRAAPETAMRRKGRK